MCGCVCSRAKAIQGYEVLSAEKDRKGRAKRGKGEENSGSD